MRGKIASLSHAKIIFGYHLEIKPVITNNLTTELMYVSLNSVMVI